MPTAVLSIDSGNAGTVASVIGPEARRDLLRTHVDVSLEDGKAVIRIEADDSSAMRAALNSYLECIMITENIDRITKGSK